MIVKEYTQYDGLGLAELVRHRQVSAEDLLDSAADAIARINPLLNAVVHDHLDLARDHLKNGISEGPFAGVPFLLKNTGCEVAGMRLSNGSRLFKQVISPADGTLAARYRQGGLQLIGKSNTPEFALSFVTEPAEFGATRNPWSLAHSPGGSSGGSAAAVAAGLVPLANASDGAGSTRVPASHCGLFGFKPSRMVNPLGPVLVEGIAGMSTPHAVTRSVRDSAALLDVTAGGDVGDPYASPVPVDTYLSAVSRGPGRLRIGLLVDSPLGDPVDPAIVAAVLQAARLCESLGHHVEPVADAGYDAAALKMAWRVITGVNVASAVEGWQRRFPAIDALSQLEPVNRSWVTEALAHSGVAYLLAVNQLHATARGLGRFFSDYDILLSPVTTQTAPPIGHMASDNASLDQFYDDFWQHGPFTCAFNAAGFPAMSVPLGMSAQGLPIGVHFGAGFAQDSRLFSLAGQLEHAAPWWGRLPALHASHSAFWMEQS
ncbi:amidase [Acerihabitans sp. TG2]|uniref:amidase n=1 Tax=Acerihabitans sp. TG2 TaxID=3096008 RepID=UPI002B2224E0|nr:amidase [Acerihabitans sp. TG2]MEA9391260.1 amidase [Acerihabitans sp. TG2]